jgi:hypothetical protein
VPSTFQRRERLVDLLIHFHGRDNVVVSAVEEAEITAAVVSVSRSGLSSAYEKPFSDAGLFRAVIDDAIRGLVDSGIVPPDTKLGRVFVSSFSAGFGAIRAILRRPEYFSMVDGIVMADSLYCGYEGPRDKRRLDAQKMADFRRFAREAALGHKFMLLTHSAQVPEGYASTTETADDLIHCVGAQRQTVAAETAGMQLLSVAALGGFHVRGFAGAEGTDHGDHLRHLADWYKMLPISRTRP